METERIQCSIRDSKLFFLKEDCVELFGAKAGKEIFARMENRYNELCGNADFKGSEAIRYHLTMNLYPTMAYYQVLREYGFEQEDALTYVRKKHENTYHLR